MSKTRTLAGPHLVRRFSRNLAGRDLIVGDVHGCFSKLRACLDRVGFNPAGGDRLFSVGDLVDRGPESAEALDWLAQPWFAALQGNHEDMAIRFGRPGCAMDVGNYAENGGAWNIGNTPYERAFVADALGALPLAIEIETADGVVGLVHADCPSPSWPAFTAALVDTSLSNNAIRELREWALWSRHRAECGWTGGVHGARAVVVGHTPVECVASLGNVIYLDTAAWFRGGDVPQPFVFLDAATMSVVAEQPAAPAVV